MARPICGLCRRTGAECHFPTKRRPPSIGNKRKRDKVQDLQGNIDQLLNLLQKSYAGQLFAEPEPMQASPASSDGLDVADVASRSGQPHYPSDGSQTEGTGVGELKTPSPRTASQHSPELCDDLLGLPGPDIASHGVIEGLQVSNTVIEPLTPVSYGLAMDLVETFFQYVQPWLPLLHKPSFMSRCTQLLNHGPDALAGLPAEFQLLMYSLFAISARYCSSQSLIAVDRLERSLLFLPAARENYTQARSVDVSTLMYLQGCVLFTFLAYTERFEFKCWVLIGVCVRVAYDLGLMELDDEDNEQAADTSEVGKEEMRRAWWLVWELDTLSSMVSRKPFAIDRHGFSVKLPVSDEAWFQGDIIRSSILLTRVDQCWESLQNVRNQDPRAWYLVANHLLSLICVQAQSKVDDATVSKSDLQVAVNCMKLSLPSCFDILTSPPAFGPTTFASNNWILGTHLTLMTAHFMTESVSMDDEQASNLLSTYCQPIDAAYHLRASQFSQIVARWPAEYIAAAHPFFLCMMLPTQVIKGGVAWPPKDNSTVDVLTLMGNQVMKRCAKIWKLGSELLGEFQATHSAPGSKFKADEFSAVSRLLRSQAESHADSALIKGYAAYFPRYKKNAYGGGQLGLTRASNDIASLDQAQTRPDLSDTYFQPNFSVPRVGVADPLSPGCDPNNQMPEWEGGSLLRNSFNQMTTVVSQQRLGDLALDFLPTDHYSDVMT